MREQEPVPMVRTELTGNGIAEVIMNNPPVNALPVAGWFDVARQVAEAGASPGVRAVVLRAEGRGFNAGVDIKEMQRTEGFTALVGANRGCFEAFKAGVEGAALDAESSNRVCLASGVLEVGEQHQAVPVDRVVPDALGGATSRAGWECPGR